MKRKTHWEIDRLNKFQRRRMARWVRHQLREDARIELNEWKEDHDQSTNS